jgi:hypothetical protein
MVSQVATCRCGSAPYVAGRAQWMGMQRMHRQADLESLIFACLRPRVRQSIGSCDFAKSIPGHRETKVGLWRRTVIGAL